MSNVYFYLLLALLAGTMMPTQAAINNKMAAFVDSPILAALVSFFVGTVALFIYSLATGTTLGNLLSARQAPVVAWLGGILGAFFVTAVIIAVPRLGVAMTFSLIVAGQMLITLFLDHFGFLGLEERPISIPRILGVILIIGGVVLIRRF
jgi:bacterial/archaeal transporter family-2 protein